VANKAETVIYTHRNFPAKMRSRIRVLASLKDTTMESIVTEGLSIGLKVVEDQVFKARGTRSLAG
jgi:hypothetical protein